MKKKSKPVFAAGFLILSLSLLRRRHPLIGIHRYLIQPRVLPLFKIMFVSELNYAGIHTHTVVLCASTPAVTLYGPFFNWQTADTLLTALYASAV